MTKKEDILGKLNMKDYNNQLEEVLEKKDFSNDTKNFLLSMLYKIEISYNDYAKVKNISKTKGEFLTEIIDTIKDNCQKIELIRPLDKEYEKYVKLKEKCIVNKKEKSITSLYNEQVLLYALSKLNPETYKIKNELIKNPLKELLENGENISKKEIIRDFDGWAWHVETKLIEDIEYNLVFQNIFMLIGENINTEAEIKANLEKLYKKEKAKKVYILICKLAILIYLKNHQEEQEWYDKQKEELLKQLEKMENKVEYLKEITEKRKKAETRVKTIDKCLTDVSFLKKEYIKENKELEEDKKIFSISDFVDIIQNEKNELICRLQKYNEQMLPKNYIKEKEKLKENLEILKVLDEKKDIYYYILDLQKKFIEGLEEKIKEIQTRKDAMDIIYKIRYYKYIPYKNTKIKEVKELQESIYNLEEMIYTTACKMNVLNTISVNNKINTQIIRSILDTNIVELENIELLFKAENYQIVLKIFDEENTEKIVQYDTIEGLTVRINKKFRLFIK